MKMKQEHNEIMIPQMPSHYADVHVKLSTYRSVFLSEDITVKVATELSALMLYYDAVSQEEPIQLYIHSNGGDIFALANIYDVMQMIKAPIRTILTGKSYSAGAVLLAAGEKGERYALQSSSVMIHGVQFGFSSLGQDINNNSNFYSFVKDKNNLIMKMLSKHTGQSLAKIKQDCVRELWMNAKQAKAYGIIDHII